jgi:hypothetical protein
MGAVALRRNGPAEGRFVELGHHETMVALRIALAARVAA